MRKFSLVILTVALSASLPVKAENPGAVMGEGLARGVANIVTCPVEIPRYISLDTAQRWYVGPLTGLGKGMLSTVYRCGFGCFDIISLGLLPPTNTPYDAFDMKPYVWQENWVKPEVQTRSLHEDRARLFWDN